MDAHEYIYFFQILNVLCIIWSTGFVVWFLSGSGPVPVHEVGRFYDCSGSDNIDDLLFNSNIIFCPSCQRGQYY